MIKRLLSDLEYTISGIDTIIIDSNISFVQKNISLIVKTLTNEIVYNFACEGFSGSVDGNTITLLDKEVSLIDELTIILILEDDSELKELEAVTLWNKRQESLLSRQIELQEETNKYLKKIYNPQYKWQKK